MKSLHIAAIFILSSTSGCGQDSTRIDYQQEMRDFVQEISEFGRAQNPNFIVIPQNGVQLVSDNGKWNGKPDKDYLDAIDGLGQESLYYGSTGDDIPTPNHLTEYLEFYLDIAKESGKTILITDYTSDPKKMDSSYVWNEDKGYISYAADSRELDQLAGYPIEIKDENNDPVRRLRDTENFLYLLNPGEYDSKEEFLGEISATNYGVVIIDAFYLGQMLTKEEISSINRKADGSLRLIISYLSIGEAEDYRYYWQDEWNSNAPDWLGDENPNWEGNYKVKYWMDSWKQIILGNKESYLQKIIDSGFDGVYLDIIDAFQYYEAKEN